MMDKVLDINIIFISTFIFFVLLFLLIYYTSNVYDWCVTLVLSKLKIKDDNEELKNFIKRFISFFVVFITILIIVNIVFLGLFFILKF